MNNFFIKKQFDLWSFPNGITIIILIAISPYLVAFIGSYFYELFIDESCNESNCFWAIIPLYMLYTIPIGVILLIIFIITKVIKK